MTETVKSPCSYLQAFLLPTLCRSTPSDAKISYRVFSIITTDRLTRL